MMSQGQYGLSRQYGLPGGTTQQRVRLFGRTCVLSGTPAWQSRPGGLLARRRALRESARQEDLRAAIEWEKRKQQQKEATPGQYGMPGGSPSPLWLEGLFEGRACRILIDSGSTGNVLSSAFVKEHSLPVTLKESGGTAVELPDGRSLAVLGRVFAADVKLGAVRTQADFVVLDIRLSADVILGMAWLEQENPCIDWEARTVTLERAAGCVEISARDTPERVDEQEFLVVLRQVPDAEPDSPGSASQHGLDQPLSELLEEFKEDVFPEDLPDGLPPDRSRTRLRLCLVRRRLHGRPTACHSLSWMRSGHSLRVTPRRGSSARRALRTLLLSYLWARKMEASACALIIDR